jgi:hypothetical protein
MDNIAKDGRFIEAINLWIDEDKYNQLKGYSANSGDVIISRAGTVGKMCVLNTQFKKSIISTNLIRVRFGNELLPLYFVSLMSYCKGRIGRLQTGADGTFTHMNTGILDNLKFPYPPIELQTQFTQIAEKTEILKTYYQSSLQELENLYGSLSQRAFRGELQFHNTEEEQPTDIIDTDKTDLISEKIVQVEKEKKEKDEVEAPVKSTKKIIPILQPVPIHREKIKQSYKIITTIKTHYRNKYFTFEEFSKKLIERGHDYKFEAIRNEIFNLLRQNKLRQIFADATFKSSFDKTHPDYNEVQELEERIYLTLKSDRK